MVQNKISSLATAAMTVLMLGAVPLTHANEVTNTQMSFGYVVDEAPLSSMQATQPTGFAVALCEKVEESIKVVHKEQKITIAYHPVTVEAGLKQLQNGDLDMLCGGVMETLSRRQQADFSTPIYLGGVSAVINQDADVALKRVLDGKQAHTGPRWRATINNGLANHSYVVHQGTVTESWLREQIKQLGVVATIKTVSTHQQGVEMVSQGKADAYFADRTELTAQIKKSALDNLQLSARIYDQGVERLAISKSNDELRLLVDRVLSNFYQSEQFIPLFNEYFGEVTPAIVEQYKGYIIPE